MTTNETQDEATRPDPAQANPAQDAAPVTTAFDVHHLAPLRVEEDTPPEEVAAYYNDEFDLDDLALHEIEAGLRYIFWVFRCVKWADPERPNPLDDPAALATRLAKATGEFVHEIIDDNRPDDGTTNPDDAKGWREIVAEALARRRAEGKGDPD